MAEAISEMIIPGTYIEVRAEGLISVSGIATGNIGIVGTANKGEQDKFVILSSFSEAVEQFGDYDGWGGGNQNELTLVRALEQVFSNGASTVYAVRCAAASISAANLILSDTTGSVVTIAGKTKGTWAHDTFVQVLAAEENGFVEERKQDVTSAALQPLHTNIATSARNSIRVVKGDTGRIIRYKLVTSGSAKKGESVKVNTADGVLSFHADDTPVDGDSLIASYEMEKSQCRQVVISHKHIKETYTIVDADDLYRDTKKSRLASVTINTDAGSRVPDVMSEAFPLKGGSNGETATPTVYKTALAKLDDEPVNIVLLAGLSAKDGASTLLSHVETAENNGRDRIAVVGVDGDDVATVSANADEVGDDRLILVAPGIQTQDLALGKKVNLNGAYAAAAVAGLISSLAVQVSPTNKVLRVSGLTKQYNDGELKKLLNSRVLALSRSGGYRIVKGISTDNAAFKQISVRRIVDYAKQGTRIGTRPYIGRLNNARIRGAMKATLNGFLSDMVLNEALTEFGLDVTATREQEIAGVALVTMYLKPTFSIDYVKVIMNLS